MLNAFPLFDSHFHIIDPAFPLVPNQGFLPEAFTVDAYRERMKGYDLQGGAIVSGSFQAFDQGYLLAALERMGDGFVGVTQIPASISDEELEKLNAAGVRAVRFNLKRGGSEDIAQLDYMARRVFDLFSWHVELYVNSIELKELKHRLCDLPKVSVDHLGLSRAGLPDVRFLLEHDVKLKACGFGRVDFDVSKVLPHLFDINPEGLMFGTDLPSTRAPRAYQDTDFSLLRASLRDDGRTRDVLFGNAAKFYRIV
ncbi:MAG: amidohydrolase family protein [Oleiphilus sp.]